MALGSLQGPSTLLYALGFRWAVMCSVLSSSIKENQVSIERSVLCLSLEVWVLSLCMCVCLGELMCSMCRQRPEPVGSVNPLMWILGTKPRSSAKAGNAVNLRALFWIPDVSMSPSGS